ncbi:MAG TPA: transposase family protein, partial [Ktedonobacteraceae bacterium]|nr:transposase family protein [Ktedonobacteraceae bacterium]
MKGPKTDPCLDRHRKSRKSTGNSYSRWRCPDCQQVSSQIHRSSTRWPKALPSSGRPVRLLLQVRRFRCVHPTCRRKTFAEAFPLLVAPRAQRTCAARGL